MDIINIYLFYTLFLVVRFMKMYCKMCFYRMPGGLMIATNATCLCEISVTQHKLFNSVPW